MAQRTTVVGFAVHEAVALRVTRVREERACGRVSRAHVEAMFPVGMDPADLVGHPARLEMGPSGEVPRVFVGMVESATCLRAGQGATDAATTAYRVVVASRLAWLEDSWTSEIHQELSSPEIVEKVLGAHGLSKTEKRLAETYPRRIYCVQYQETALDFVTRLAEDDGYWLLPEPTDDGDETLVLADRSSAAEPMDGDPVLHLRRDAGMGASADRLVSLVEREKLRSGTFTLRDYAFETPALDLTVNATGTQRPDLEVYVWPGGYEDQGEGKRRVKLRLEEERVEARLVDIVAECHRLVPGRHVELAETEDADGRYFVVSVVHEFVDVSGSEDAVRARATLLPLDTPYRLPRVTPVPRIEGPQTARIVAPAGSPAQTIHTDEHARVKVKFNWDRSDVTDDKASCWMRVTQLQTSGSLIIPRIGWEVLVEFLEGDPDRPIVTGRLYNGVFMPPYALPEGKTRTAIKSASTPGGDGVNEIRLEDKAGGEEIMIFAQKDARTVVANNAQRTIGNNDSIQVGNDSTLKVGANQTTKITKGSSSEVGANQTVSVGGNRNYEVNAVLGLTVKGSATTSASGNQFEMNGNPLEALLALAAAKAAEFATAMADNAVAAVKSQVDGALNQVMAPVNALGAKAQGLADAMSAVGGGDLGALGSMVAAGAGLPTASQMGAQMAGGDGGEGGGGEGGGGQAGGGRAGGGGGHPASGATNALAAIAQSAAHQAIQQGVKAGAAAIGEALGLDAAGGGGASGANEAGPDGTVGGLDATDREKGPGHSTAAIKGSHAETIGTLKVLAALQAIDTNIGGAATQNVGAATLQIAVGDIKETVGGDKVEKALGLAVLTKGGESEKVGGSKTTMVGGAIVDKLGGTHSITAAGPATFIGAFHKVDASGKITIKCGGSEVVLDGGGATIKAPMVVILAPKIQAKKKVSEL